MGLLCCVAARPHGTSTASQEWSSIGRSDPPWRTGAGFSPPLSRGWEYRINSEGLSYGSHGDSGIAVNYGSSLSSNSKGASRSWERNELPQEHRYSTSEGAISYLNSPDVSFQNHHIMLPMLQDSSVDEYMRGMCLGVANFSVLFDVSAAFVIFIFLGLRMFKIVQTQDLYFIFAFCTMHQFKFLFMCHFVPCCCLILIYLLPWFFRHCLGVEPGIP
jgi:hypothetical protein